MVNTVATFVVANSDKNVMMPRFRAKKQLQICENVLSNKFQFKWQDDLESNTYYL